MRKRDLEELQIAQFERDNIDLGKIKKLKTYKQNYDMEISMNEDDKKRRDKELMVKALTQKSTLALDNHDLKKDLIQTSFWMAESDRSRLTALKIAKDKQEEKKPSKKMVCPGDNKHKIKAKTVYPLKFDKGFICFACNKKLAFQKIVSMRTCGHVMCMECLNDFCLKGKACLCGKAFLPGDIIKMEETKSSFSLHNDVEAKVYQPAFAI